MKANKPTITVGVPAYNEEQNIRRLLESVLNQYQTEYQLERVIIISDGSSDRTVTIAKSINDPLIDVVDHREQSGKMARLYELFNSSKSDYLVLVDADVVLEKHALAALIRPMLQDEHIWLTSGKPVKVQGKTLMDKVMQVSINLQDYVKENMSGGRSIYGCHGRIIGMRRALQEQMRSTMEESRIDDTFFYLFNKKSGHAFQYVSEARCYFKMPQTIADFTKQRVRFENTQKEMIKIFGVIITDEFKIPKRVKIKALFLTFLQHPFLSVAYILMQILSRSQPIQQSNWGVAHSTKKL